MLCPRELKKHDRRRVFSEGWAAAAKWLLGAAPQAFLRLWKTLNLQVRTFSTFSSTLLTSCFSVRLPSDVEVTWRAEGTTQRSEGSLSVYSEASGLSSRRGALL